LLRNLGANDYSGGTSFNGSGNDFPMIGNTVFSSYFSLKIFLGKEASQTRVQPNIAIQYSDFEGLMKWLLLILGQPVFKGMQIN
jgi:hypothetical protein